MRWGPGPVFLYECLANSRRWQTYALRAVGVGALLSAMGFVALSSDATTGGNSYRDYAKLGQSYFFALIGVELALVMFAAPAATAGSICVDRARGTLAHMLMTDLSDPEIVLGKLAARLLPVFGLVACSWPVMAISSLLGGIDPVALVLAFAIIVVVAVLGCATALALSVWARKSHEVILATYMVFILGLLLWPIWMGIMSGSWAPDWTLLANPFYVAFAPYAVPDKLGFWDYLIFFGVSLGASAGLIVLAVWKMRTVACRGPVETSKGPRIGLIGRITRWLPGPSLDRSPVLWREWHRARPSRWMMFLLVCLMGTTGLLCIIGAIAIWKNGVQIGPSFSWETAGIYGYLLHLIFGLLMLSAVAPTSMAEEWQRGSLDILAATALSSRSIVVGKWLGTFRLAALLAVCPGFIALAMATARQASPMPTWAGMPPDYFHEILLGARLFGVLVVIGTILAHGALITSIGLALAVWIKRQSRAIAFSVGLFVLIVMTWPIVAMIVFSPAQSRADGIAALSPMAACAAFVRVLTTRRYFNTGEIFGWASAWVVVVPILAMGLLWLTIRSIDGCFDRISDRPWRHPVRAVLVMILAGMIGAGSLVGAIAVWVEGIDRIDGARETQGLMQGFGHASTTGLLAYTLVIALGLTLAGASSAAALSAWRRRQAAALRKDPPRPMPAGEDRSPDVDAATRPGKAIPRLAWESYRLVVLLAIGPALLATALATCRENPRYLPKFTKDASGAQVVTYVRAGEGVVRVGALSLRDRLIDVALLAATILAHGAVAVAHGLALATAIERPWLALGATVGASLFLIVGFPISLVVRHPDALLVTLWGFLTGVYTLLGEVATSTSVEIPELGRWVLLVDLVLALIAVGLLYSTVRIWQRRLLGTTGRKSQPGAADELEPAAVEPALIGD
jgi:ABC-type transport system involved in multi-copper enzyme maturation permease subunit